MAEYTRPLPSPTKFSRGFWEGAKRHELVVQRCRDCGRYRHSPKPACPHCLSTDTEWARVSGRGTVYTYTVHYRAPAPAFGSDLPLVTALIELEEGPLMMSNIVGCPPEKVSIGMPVEVVFEDATEQITFPRFKPR
ncbi:MAG: Zn-ribbon domain-containing OB-fold protein [Chloroflexota bacterium]|nr:Zn-ribbon domain-containing OB-fold protein [Chloroflexota bacterium]